MIVTIRWSGAFASEPRRDRSSFGVGEDAGNVPGLEPIATFGRRREFGVLVHSGDDHLGFDARVP